MSAPPEDLRHEHVEELLEDWPEEPREIAEDMMDEYGIPDEAAAGRLVWQGNGPWKRTELVRDGVPHRFPKEHTDYLEQFIDYQVPTEKADELTAFDGSVVIDRTKGELSARCDREAMNILALNLAHDIVREDTDVDGARHDYAVKAMKAMVGASPAYAEELQFNPTAGGGDPDRTIVTDELQTEIEQEIEDMRRRGPGGGER